MKNFQLYQLFIFFGIIFGSLNSFAQEKEQDTLAIAKEEVNRDDLGMVEDRFQHYFFQALSQRGIENYERAVQALQKCQEVKPDNVAVLYELGKNYKDLEDYPTSEKYLKQALDEKSGNQDLLTELYDVYYLTQDYTKAINIARQLSKFNINYYEDLANLYVRTQQYKEAIVALDYIDSREGQDDYRVALRSKIYAESEDKSLEENYLQQQIEASPKDTDAYISLMYFYAKQNKLEKTYQVAEQLLAVYPNSKEAHFALYKNYLANYEDQKAIASMKKVIKSDLGDQMKKEVVQDFIQLAKEKPEYEEELMQFLDEELGQTGQSNKQLAAFYRENNNNKKAILNLESALQENPTDFNTAKDLMLMYIDENLPQKSLDLAENFLSIYPSQTILYLISGVSYNMLEQPKKAEEVLLMGLDFLIDNNQMEIDFYNQLKVSYYGLDDKTKFEEAQKKVENLKKQAD